MKQSEVEQQHYKMQEGLKEMGIFKDYKIVAVGYLDITEELGL